jgi:hypothetical protein
VRILPRHLAQVTDINLVGQLLLLELRRELGCAIAMHAPRAGHDQEFTKAFRFSVAELRFLVVHGLVRLINRFVFASQRQVMAEEWGKHKLRSWLRVMPVCR